MFKLKEEKFNKKIVLNLKGFKLEAIFKVEVQGNICVVCSREVKQWSLGKKGSRRVFCVCYVFKRNQTLKFMKDFLFLCSYVFKVKKKLSVKTWESKRKIERKLGWKIQKVNCRFNFIFLVVCVHACGFIHVCYLWQTWVEFFSCVVFKLVMMAMASFAMVWQHVSLLTTCSSCSSLSLLLLLVVFSFISIVVHDHVFIHFYYCSIWSCSYLFLLLLLLMLLLIFATVHGHAITHLYFWSWSCSHPSL